MDQPLGQWKRLLKLFSRTSRSLGAALELAEQRPLTRLEQQGLMHLFQSNHALGCVVLKHYLESRGFVGMTTSNASREAFRLGLIDEGGIWGDLLQARRRVMVSVHPKGIDDLVEEVLSCHAPALLQIEARFRDLARKDRRRKSG